MKTNKSIFLRCSHRFSPIIQKRILLKPGFSTFKTAYLVASFNIRLKIIHAVMIMCITEMVSLLQLALHHQSCSESLFSNRNHCFFYSLFGTVTIEIVLELSHRSSYPYHLRDPPSSSLVYVHALMHKLRI